MFLIYYVFIFSYYNFRGNKHKVYELLPQNMFGFECSSYFFLQFFVFISTLLFNLLLSRLGIDRFFLFCFQRMLKDFYGVLVKSFSSRLKVSKTDA